MHRLPFTFLVCVSFFFACQSPTPTDSSSPTPPNVILVITDDQGYGDIAAHGNPHIQTPHLDKLYGQSIRLTDFHVGTTCAPTRASVMTGQNCNAVDVWHTIGGRSQLYPEATTLADVFAHNGYRTGMFGKWHLGDNYPFRPHDRGFQETLYHGGGGVGQEPDYWNNDYFDDTYFRNGTPEKREGYCTTVWFDAAMEFMDGAEKPFFCYLATNAPHGPFHVDSSYIRPYLGNEAIPNANFYGMITQFDEQMGRLMDYLETSGKAENTILIYMTDNGTAAGVNLDKEQYATQGFSANMRGKKGSQYEGGHRVPCYIRWPEKGWNTGRDISQLTAHVDLFPTLIELGALAYPEEMNLYGRNLSPLLNGDASDAIWAERVLITDTQRAEQLEKWKRCAIMQGPWRLVDGDELYNIQQDPEQRNNLAEERSEFVHELRVAYDKWWKKLEPNRNRYTRTILGENEEEVVLYSHDWHESKNPDGTPGGTPWNHGHVRRGTPWIGFWTVDVAEAGDYIFELRRWPREAATPLTAGLPVLAAVPGGRPSPGGEALPLERAFIQLGEQKQEQPIQGEEEAIRFELELAAGPTRLTAGFRDKEWVEWGAYYVYVKRKA